MTKSSVFTNSGVPQPGNSHPTPATRDAAQSNPNATAAAAPPNDAPHTYHPPAPTSSNAVTQLSAFFSRLSLRTRLTAIVMLVLLAGLLVAAILTSTLLKSYLISEIDNDLSTTYTNISQQILQDQTNTSLLPSDYYLAFFQSDGTIRKWASAQTLEQRGVPNLEQYIVKKFTTTGAVPAEPFTTASVSSETQWRVLVRQVSNGYGDPVGQVYVALPLTDSYAIIEQIQNVLLVSAIVITALGGVIGALAVQRSLRPLVNIEKTAATIATGDLTQRVPQPPDSTEVGSLAKSLNSMLSQLEDAFAVQEASETRMRRFVSDASHELRTPLATIRGYGELYRMGALQTPEAVDDTMRRIEDSAARMGNLVEDLLHLARLDERKAAATAPVDIAVLAVDAMSDLHALDPSRTVKLVELVPGQPTGTTLVLGDENKLRQVLANLVGNVVGHTPAGSPVEIALGTTARNSPLNAAPLDGGAASSKAVSREPDSSGSIVVLEVRDHGPGIDEVHTERIFERFYRVDSSRARQSGGSGLGLAIVSAIVSAHSGTISVKDTEGGGLTVRVEFPTYHEPAAG